MGKKPDNIPDEIWETLQTQQKQISIGILIKGLWGGAFVALFVGSFLKLVDFVGWIALDSFSFNCFVGVSFFIGVGLFATQ